MIFDAFRFESIFWLAVAIITTVFLIANLLFFRYWRIARQAAAAGSESQPVTGLPPAAVVLCVRGADAQFKQCLREIFRQDYPDYHLFIVIDHQSDPAWDQVHQAIAEHQFENVTVQQLRNKRDTCSLKCSAILQAIEMIPDRFERCAFIDADVIPRTDWLKTLMRHLQDDAVGVVFGCRWFLASRGNLAAVFRYSYTIFSAVFSELFRVPWGGSLAARTECFKSPDVLDRLAHAFVEDTIYFELMHRQNKQTRYAANLVMPNRSNCEFPGIFKWASRQCFNTKLYYPYWWVMVCASIFFVIANTISGTMAIATIAMQRFELTGILLALIGLQLFTTTLLMVLIDREKLRLLKSQGEDVSQSPGLLTRTFGAVILSTVAMPSLTFQTYLMKTVRWRGISYRIDGPWKVHRLNYSVFYASTPRPTTTEPVVSEMAPVKQLNST